MGGEYPRTPPAIADMIFLLLFVLCVTLAVGCSVWEASQGNNFRGYLPWPNEDDTSTYIAFLVFWSYIIIMNTVVPISLYVSVEIIRMLQSWMIDWDDKMCHEGTHASARTTTLNEELGQIEYIFSDKTGTLTQNIMVFNMCSINGVVYGPPDESNLDMEITKDTPRVDFSANQWYEENFKFYDHRLLPKVSSPTPSHERDFFFLLAVCHTVMCEEKGQLVYQAQSPDEAALVGAARNFGLVFKSRSSCDIVIEENGVDVVYEVLNILDFDNVRKRMSIVIRDPVTQLISLYCKGADNKISEKLDSNNDPLWGLTTMHLESFASKGLRTLALARKLISEEDYAAWVAENELVYNEASMAAREIKTAELIDKLESNLELIGATAIEDKLQDGVPQTIANLAEANIKIWVLTGDKQETAINIGYSCCLLHDDLVDTFILNEDSVSELDERLSVVSETLRTHSMWNARPAYTSRPDMKEGSGDHEERTSNGSPGQFALVIPGSTLVHALDPKLKARFLEVACKCVAVICCRVTPLQKANVVQLVMKAEKKITLSIGDGANDVNMIKTAHIGVGISGQEGLQAVLASDYSLAQFRFLERLLLVHGRWSYFRMAKFLRYFFYKNIAFSMVHFWFAFFNGFSAQSIYDFLFIMMYNLVYTSLPVLVMGVCDQDVNDRYCIRFPKLYKPGQDNQLFNMGKFFMSFLVGLYTATVLFFVPYSVYSVSNQTASLQALGGTIAPCMIVAVTIRIAIDTQHWTFISHICIWGSVLIYPVIQYIIYSTSFYLWIPLEYVGVHEIVFANPAFWLCLVLCTILSNIPTIGFRWYNSSFNPTLSHKVRHLQNENYKPKKRSPKLFHRRSQTGRRNSSRTGFAFDPAPQSGKRIRDGSAFFDKDRRRKRPVTADSVLEKKRYVPRLPPSIKRRPAADTPVNDDNTPPDIELKPLRIYSAPARFTDDVESDIVML